MTELPHRPAAAPSGKKILTLSLPLLGALLLLAATADYAFNTAQTFGGLRNECLLSLVTAGLGMTVCLAGFIYILDLPLTPREAEGFDRSLGPPWCFRILLALAKWLAMVLQLAAMGLALAAAGILIFGFAVPNSRPATVAATANPAAEHPPAKRTPHSGRREFSRNAKPPA